jgi:hypothetical protein
MGTKCRLQQGENTLKSTCSLISLNSAYYLTIRTISDKANFLKSLANQTLHISYKFSLLYPLLKWFIWTEADSLELILFVETCTFGDNVTDDCRARCHHFLTGRVFFPEVSLPSLQASTLGFSPIARKTSLTALSSSQFSCSRRPKIIRFLRRSS